MMKNSKPPKWAKRLVKLFSSRDEVRSMLHGFDEEFYELTETDGAHRANIWYWKQTLRSIPKLTKSSIYWGGIMFKSYFTIAIRNIKKYKGYSFINTFGLAVGIASCLLILLFVQDELSYDRYNENVDRIY